MQNHPEVQYNVIRSCDDKIEEDPIKDPSSVDSSEIKPRPRSFKEENNSEWSTPIKEQKIKKLKEIEKNEEKKGKGSSWNKNRNDKNFTDEIIDSEEVSVSESQNGSSKDHKEEPKLNPVIAQPSKKTYFNLMLLGAASTGKTTYVECFSKEYKQKTDAQLIKNHTDEIQETKIQPILQNLNLEFTIVDTPGFSHSTIDNYSRMVQKEIKNRIDTYQHEFKKGMTESSVYQKEEREPKDTRIHCCLFFFRGPRSHGDDWRLIEELHDKCNIIPVIAKGDTYSVEELIQFKRIVTETARKRNIYWFDVQEYIRQKHPESLDLVTKGSYGPSPPFMLACSTVQVESSQGLRLGREYKWGTCVIEDEKHTEFSVLNKLLIRELREGFVKMTTIKQEEHHKKIKVETTLKLPSVFTVTALGVGLAYVGLQIYKHHLSKN